MEYTPNYGTKFVPATVKGKGGVAERHIIKDGDREIVLTGRDAEVVARAQYFATVSDDVLKAMACFLADIDKDFAKRYGIKSMNRVLEIATNNAKDGNTLSKYRRVGRIFGTIGKDGKPAWKDPIPQGASITNLTSCLGLLDLPRDIDDLTPEEVDAVFNDFVAKFCDPTLTSYLRSLQGSLTALRAEIHDYNTSVDGGATAPKKGKKGKKGGDNPAPLTPEERINLALADLAEHFADNDHAFALVKELTELWTAEINVQEVETENK